MAITYLVGIPRSGKTYYAVYQLWKNFVFVPKKSFLNKFKKNKNKKVYDLAYTNINQFDFSKSSKFKKLDFDELSGNLSILYNLYLQKEPDVVLVEKAKELKLYNVLIVIDEVHNFLGDKVNDVYKWWLTYHGHLYQDLFFITQDLSLVAAQYKNNAEFFYKAVPPSKRLFSGKFRYAQYANSRMAMNGKVADFSLPALQDVYKMYVSGASNNAKSFIHKYLKYAFVLFVLLIVLSSYFYYSLEDKVPVSTHKDINITKKNILAPVVSDNISSSSINHNFSLKYSNFLVLHFLNNICFYKNNRFPIGILQYFIKNKFVKVLRVSVFSNKDVYIYLLVSNKFLRLFGGTKNEKKSNSNSAFSGNFFSSK